MTEEAEQAQKKKIFELERLLEERTNELEMTTILLKNEIEVRSSFESDLQESEERFRTIAEVTPLGMMLVNQDNAIIYMNPQLTRSFGYVPKDLPDIITAIETLLAHESDRKLAVDRWHHRAWSMERSVLESEPVVYEMIARDGSQKTCELYFAPYGQVVLILLHDITIRKKALDALHESERRYREMIEKMPLVAVILDLEGKVVFANEYLCELTGWGTQEILGLDWFSTFTRPEDNMKEVFLDYLHTDMMPPQFENAIQSKKGDLHLILWTNLVIRSAEDGVSGIVSLGTDITERKQREQAVQLANKKLNILSSISRHDIANTLTELFLTLELAQDNMENPGSQQLISEALDAIRTIRDQIEFTRFYQDIGVHAPEWYDLTRIITYAVNEISFPDISFTIKTDQVSIYADPLIQKVFYNLIDNAIRHGEKVKTIIFDIMYDGKDLIIRYCDDGVGVPSEDKVRIFERGVGKHTGMGLFLIREILAITHIDIAESGEYGTGAVFNMRVPKGIWRKETQMK